MAEILIKAVDAVMSDPTLDSQQSFKQGHPVVVMPDGWAWGNEEKLPLFYILKLPGVSVDSVTAYLAPWTDVDGTTLIGPRLWRIIFSSLPTNVKNTLNVTGQYSTTWSVIKAYFKNLKDGSTPP